MHLLNAIIKLPNSNKSNINHFKILPIKIHLNQYLKVMQRFKNQIKKVIQKLSIQMIIKKDKNQNLRLTMHHKIETPKPNSKIDFRKSKNNRISN